MYAHIPNPVNPNDVVAISPEQLLNCLPTDEHQVLVEQGLNPFFDFGHNVATAHDAGDYDWTAQASNPLSI